MRTPEFYAAVLLLLVIIVAACVYRFFSLRAEPRGDGFMPGDAATPKLREAVALVGSNLTCISRIANTIQGRGQKIEGYGLVDLGSAFNEARLSLDRAQTCLSRIVGGVKSFNSTLSKMAPTYQNVLGLYRNLRDSDASFWGAAEDLDVVGSQIQSLVSSTDGHTHTGHQYMNEFKRDLGSAAIQIRQVSTCLYNLVRSIHILGNALLLE